MDNLKDLVRTLYADCFTVNTRTDLAATMGALLADNFESIGSVETKTKAQLISQMQFFWKLVPDLRWEVAEMIQEANKVVVRSIATGTPNGDFMGVPTNGSRSFRIMTIDVHTVVDHQLRSVHHLEDWATAMKQLKG